MALVIIVPLVNYLDTKTRTYFLEVLIFGICTLLGTVVFVFAENYMTVMGHYLHYTDNLNMRFWFTIFFVIAVIYLAKVAADFYFIEENPSILDLYCVAKNAGVTDLDGFLGQVVATTKVEESIASSKAS
jgi:hypothetical protein